LARQHVFTPKSVCDESQPPAEGLQEPTQSEVRRSDLLRTLTHESWLEVFPSLSVSGIVRNILANTQWEEFSEGILLLRLAEDQSALYSEEILPKLESALTQYFGEPVSLKITVGVVDVETPALKAQRLMKEARLSMVNEFETDTNVRELVDRFAATVETGSIVPLNDEGLAYD
jgi:DNA polymerase-3 subunit gamma/tau